MPKPIIAIRTYPRIFALAIFLFLSSLVVTAASLGKTTSGGDDGSGIGGTGRIGGSGLGGTGAPYFGVKNDVENGSEKFDIDLPELNVSAPQHQETIEAITHPAIEIEIAHTNNVDSAHHNPAAEIQLPVLDLPKLLTQSLEENSLHTVITPQRQEAYGDKTGTNPSLYSANLDLLDEAVRVELDVAQLETEPGIPTMPPSLDEEIIAARQGPQATEHTTDIAPPPPVIKTMAEALFALAIANKTAVPAEGQGNFEALLTPAHQQLAESIPVSLTELLPRAEANERSVKAPGFFRRPEIPRVQRILPVQRIILPPRLQPMRI